MGKNFSLIISIAPARDNFKLSQVVPVVVISPLIALVQISATDPVAIYPLQLFVSIRAIRGQKLIRCLLHPQETTSCLKLYLLSSYPPIIALV